MQWHLLAMNAKTNIRTVAVGLSGGIDSGTTALMLKEQGHDVIGVTMWLFDHQAEELNAAKRVADALKIPHYILDYRKAFADTVIHNFIASYEQGFTPNPCLLCNRKFKYGRLISDCITLGATHFATGHYARVEKDALTGEHVLYRAENKRKDQSYNLYHLGQDTLSKLVFPLGSVESKEAVRARFATLSVSISEKKDSLGICFIKDKNHMNFLTVNESTSMSPGKFVDTEGNLLGIHQGIAQFTVGQKRRLGLDLNGQYLNGRYVVVAINPSTNEVCLGQESDLLYHTVITEEFNFIRPSIQSKLHDSNQRMAVEVILSQWSEVYKGELSLLENSTRARLTFDTPVRAPAKGQALACYVGDELIGGGIISLHHRELLIK